MRVSWLVDDSIDIVEFYQNYNYQDHSHRSLRQADFVVCAS